MSLYQAIFEHDVEHILYETGVLLKRGDTDVVEDTWIRVLCSIAEHIVVTEAKLLLELLQSLDALLMQNQMMIRDSFLMSVKLSYLLKRVKRHARAKPSIQKLRDKIKLLFPEKAALSPDGLVTFASVLPPSEKEEEYQFAQRIIAGLSKLWTEGKQEDSRNCLEYLSRKKLSVLDETDMIDFLWGVIAIFFKGEQNVATTFRIYNWNETKKTRKERLGLLWGIFYWVQSCRENVATAWWMDEELQILQKIADKHKDLWDQLQEEETPQKNKDIKGVDVMQNFEPRGTTEEAYFEPYEDQRKNIDLTKTKISGMAQKHVKEKSSTDSKSRHNEAYHLDPRYWRIHSGKKGSGV